MYAHASVHLKNTLHPEVPKPYASYDGLRAAEDPGAKILIFIGRWVKQKGVDHIAMLTKVGEILKGVVGDVGNAG